MKNSNNELKKEIGLFGMSANIVNIVIGSGIFVIPAIVAAGLGSASIIAYIYCGFIALMLMLCYAEVGSRVTGSGGAYKYLGVPFGPYAGYLAAMLFLLSTISACAAIVNAVAEIVFRIYPTIEGSLMRQLIFVILLGGFALINIRGVKEGVGFVKLITIIKLSPLILLALYGLPQIEINNLVWEEIPTMKSVGETSLILFFAFSGVGAALSISGEVKNPSKVIPKAILISLFTVLILYIAIQTVAQGILGNSLSNFTENPLGEVAQVLIGPIGFSLLTIAALVSIVGTISSVIMSAPRLLFAASSENVIPVKFFSKIHPVYKTPYTSIISYTLVCYFIANLGGFKEMAIISSAASLLIGLGISIAVIILRKRERQVGTNEIFQIPGSFTVPILSVVFIIWFLSNLSKTELLTVSGYIVILSVIYFLFTKFSKKHKKQKK